MYIKIGKTDIKYRSDVNDYMIFSEIPDSQLSYEKPVLVRTKDELDIWFGRDFTSRDYFDELIKQGVTLYLYKPIKENNTHDIDDYIDIETYYIFPEIFLELPEIGEPGYSYYLQTIDPIKHYYKFDLDINTNNYTWLPVDTLDGCIIDSREFPSIYDLPNTGEEGYIYYVENIPESRFWYIYNNNSWIEAGQDYKNYTPYRKMFSNYDSLPQGGGEFKYFVIFDMSWYIWEEDSWVKTDNNNSLQEFPIHFDTVEDLPWIGNNYRYYVDGVWYIWLYYSWTPETIFPQNLDNISSSLNNRDTLMISKPDDEDQNFIPYSYPEFRLYNDNHLGVFSDSYDINFSKSISVDRDTIEKINLGYKTMAIKIKYISEELDDGYIIIKNILPSTISLDSGKNICIYSGNKPSLSATYFDDQIQISTVSELIYEFSELGYYTKKIRDSEYLVYASYIFDFTEFYTYKNIILENSFNDTHNILTKYLENNKEIEFYSKTIGSNYKNSENNKDSLISVNIENIEYERYRITIRRYDYTEIFEGSLFSEIDNERLDNIINKNSKLVVCNFTGLKNYIKPIKYRGLIEDTNLESDDFSLHFKTKNIYCYIPQTGEIGYKYFECKDEYGNEVWKVWDASSDIVPSWKIISPDDLNFYDLENKMLDFPNIDSLPVEGNSDYRYYVNDQEKWYTWKDNEWVVFDTGIVVGSEYTIDIRRLGYEKFAIYIVAGNLSEAYIGNLYNLTEEINRDSEILDRFKFKGLCNTLREGIYYLRRGENEEQTRDMYIKSLGCLFDTQIENIWPDFFLVPDIKKYINKLGETENYYNEYKNIFLEHAKNFNCQFLIQNNESEYKILEVKDLSNIEEKNSNIIYTDKERTFYKIYIPEIDDFEDFTDREAIEISENGGDFIYNYTKDTSNYLVYFFKPLTVFEYPRPAYYVFLRGVLNNIYSVEETEVNYDSPLESDPYELDKDVISELLEKYKSNFLINNNHIFYYKKYFNGPKYYSTVWMRFVLGKIYRELHKNRWTYLALKSSGIIETNIKTTLWKIKNRFSIVKFINIVEFKPNLSKNYLEIKIDTYVSDLINNNMTLDITVNYNEINTD